MNPMGLTPPAKLRLRLDLHDLLSVLVTDHFHLGLGHVEAFHDRDGVANIARPAFRIERKVRGEQHLLGFG